MKNFVLIFLIAVFLVPALSFAQRQGSGSGSGGRSAVHAGGGNHSGAHGGRQATSRPGGANHGAGPHGTGRPVGNRQPNTGRPMGTTERTTSGPLPRLNMTNGFGYSPRNNTHNTPKRGIVVPPNNNYHPNEHWNSYPYYYYGYYGYEPFYDPYFSMWSFGANFMYTPHYFVPGGSGYNNTESSNGNDYMDIEPMQGFLVYEHDTITGDITMNANSVSLETADTVQSYDYKFKMKQEGLQYVSVYNNNDTNNQLNLVRLKGEKKLMRQVHTGKLNIYDGRHGFIYRPEDIEAGSIAVVYNGQEDALHSSSVNKAKAWLTNYVNKAYGLGLDPTNFTWKELLIYIDKLD